SLWTTIVGGWASSTFDADQWEQVLRLVHGTPVIERHAARAVADLLEHAVDEGTKAPDAFLSTVVDVAERLLLRADLQDGVVHKPASDWLTLAIYQSPSRA